MTVDNLFRPIQVGDIQLKHRVGLAPLTRLRANDDGSPTDLVAEYYGQRAAQSKGALLVSEATFISKNAGIYKNVPGIWSDKQIAGWTKVADTVHKEGSYLYIQLWNLGIMADKKVNDELGVPYVAPSAVELRDRLRAPSESEPTPIPSEITKDQINQFIRDYAQAAKNSIAAGADGVEIHGANGYLIHQFLSPILNKRTDEYGGSIENRSRFLFEAVDAVIDAIGAEKTAIRLSPWLNTSGGEYDISPLPVFSYIITELQRRALNGKQLAYISVVEPRVVRQQDVPVYGDNEWIRTIWKGVLFRAGGLNRELALDITNRDDNTIVGFGRYFISNPDLEQKLKTGEKVYQYDRDTFYSKGKEGYTEFTGDRLEVSL